MKRNWILVAAVLVSFTAASAASGRKLTDAELDQVAAGTFDAKVLDGALQFGFDSGTSLPNRVSGSGKVSLQAAGLPSCTPPACSSSTVITPSLSVSGISLSGNAQAGMSSLINVLAVNSIVNVLTNININIDSPNARVQQGNGVGGLVLMTGQ